MNQILSVEMPQKHEKKRKEPKKASTKSILIFFSIVLVIFGVLLIGFAIFKNMNSKSENQNENIIDDNQPSVVSDNTIKPKIEMFQKETTVEIEVSGEKEISQIQYSWNDGELNEQATNGSNKISFELIVPEGLNSLKVIAKDIDGGTEELVNSSLVGKPQPVDDSQINLKLNPDTNKLYIICQGSKIINTLSYNYDEEEPKSKTINDTSAEVEIPINQGAHNLTIKAIYEDGTTKEEKQKVFFPLIEKVTFINNGEYAVIKASDERGISRVTINFNGEDLPEETPNSITFEKQILSVKGENRLIVTVYNKDGVSSIRKTYWVIE